MNMKVYASFMMALFLVFSLAWCGTAKNGKSEEAAMTAAPSGASPTASSAAMTAASPNQTASGQATVRFDYRTQPGHASNQFAVWIEDAEGNLVKTLYATRFTANGGYRNRPDSIFNWVAKSGLADMPKEQVDAVTGATPQSGKLVYVWDLTDDGGNAVPVGGYTFFVEGTMRWKNYVLFSGDIAVGGETAAVTAEPTYYFEADGGNAALTEDSTETGMLANVAAEYIPAESITQ
ncbi:MAG: DUF2271 domain-containing protein [Clostridiales bacterium]|jgi:hypothetical protein|nr:DUF2271 domain-containing protein [Clostridiales bacterium]